MIKRKHMNTRERNCIQYVTTLLLSWLYGYDPGKDTIKLDELYLWICMILHNTQ